MNEKPLLKKEVAVRNVVQLDGLYSSITFHATPDAMTEFAEFGEMMNWGGGYKLFVDPRYDFNEVLAYINNYG